MKTSITTWYNGLSECEIRTMSHEQLVQMVLRVVNMEAKECSEWRGSCLLMDDVADELRGRE